MCVGVFAKYGSGAFKDEATDVLDAIPKLPDKFGLQVKQTLFLTYKGLFIESTCLHLSGISETHKVGNIDIIGISRQLCIPMHLQCPSLFTTIWP